MPWKTIVPPVFVQDVAVFFIVDSASAGWLYFYRFNAISNFFELKSTSQVVTTVASGWETKTSLVRTTTGVIFKASGQSTIYHYTVTDYAYTQSTVTTSQGTISAYMGTVSWNDLVLIQRRDDPYTYSTAETANPTIYGFMNNDYVVQYDYASSTLTATASIAMPCNTNQVSAGCANERMWITLQREWIDVGTNYLAVLSPVNCASVYQTTAITNASVRYYALATTADNDSDYNGLTDETQSDADSSNHVTVDWDKGWTCQDLDTAYNWQANTSFFWAGNWL